MKKIVTLLLALCMVFALTCALAAEDIDTSDKVNGPCPNGTDGQHKFDPKAHDEALYVAPTCHTAGKKVLYCVNKNCQERVNLTLEPTGTSKTVTTPATCTAEGSVDTICVTCGFVSSKKTDKIAHVAGQKHEIQADCCNWGGYQTLCVSCGKVMSEEKLIAPYRHSTLGEDYVVEDKAPTCTEAGYHKALCIKYGTLLPSSYDIPAVKHSWEQANPVAYKTVDATCTEDGYILYVCTNEFNGKACGAVNTIVLPKLGHDMDRNNDDKVNEADYLTKEATCTKEGKVYLACERTGCKEEVLIRTIEKKEHKWIHKDDLCIPQGCTQEGLDVWRCYDCKENRYEVLPMLPHDLKTHTVKPTCIATGKTEVYCVNCQYTEDTVILEKVDHDYKYTAVAGKKADCVKAGECTVTCKTPGCDYGVAKVVKQTIPARGHKMSETVVKEATCTEDGYKYQYCLNYDENDLYLACEHAVVSEIILAKKHTKVFDQKSKVEPTCRDAGSIDWKCSVCKDEGTDELAKLPHTLVVVHSDATASKHAVDTEFCTAAKCGYEKTTEIHTPGDWTVKTPATCVKEGEKVRVKCTLATCKLHAEVETKVIEKADHDFVAIEEGTVAATCTKEGTQAYKCKNCDEKKTETIGKLDHVSNWTVKTESTCTVAGTTELICKDCQTVVETKELPLKEHVAGEAVVKTAATCTEDGENTISCTVCETLIETVKVEAPGHKAGEWVIEADPTCEAEGIAVKYCTVCEVELERQEIKVKGHTNEVLAAVEPTCTETGLTEGLACSVCGKVEIAQEVVPAKGHVEEAVAGTAATCTLEGLTDGTVCTVCDAVVVAQEVIPALGHTEVIDAAVAATCTEAGITEGKHCSVCNEVIVAQEVVAALGHDWNAAGYEDPRCVKAGTVYSTCGNCGLDIAEPIKARVSAKDVFVIEAEEDVFTLTIDEALFAEITEAKAKFVHFVVDGLTVCIPVEAITVDATTAFEVQVADGAFTLFTIVNGEATDITEKAEELDVIIEK